MTVKTDPLNTNQNNNSSGLVTRQQDRIIESAKKCFLEQGLSHTTMRDIATMAEMSLGNIYRYFSNKEALIQEFIARENQEIDEAFLLLNDTKGFKKMLKLIAKEYIKEMSVKAELLIYFDILSEALRNETIMEIIELEKGEQSLLQSLKLAEKEKRIELLLPAEVAAFSIISFIESSALKRIINQNYSMRLANKQFSQYIDAIIHEKKLGNI